MPLRSTEKKRSSIIFHLLILTLPVLLSFQTPLAQAKDMRLGQCKESRNFRQLRKECTIYTRKTLPVKKCTAFGNSRRQHCHWVMQSVREKNSRQVLREPNPYFRR